MASGWYNEPRRHALSAKGIKNAIDHKPLHKVPTEKYYEDEEGTLRGRCPAHGEFVGDAIGCPRCLAESEEAEAREDERKQYYAHLQEMEDEIRPIIGFLKVYWNEDQTKARVSLKDDISFSDFQKFFPEIKKKQLVRLFDKLDDEQDITAQAIMNINKNKSKEALVGGKADGKDNDDFDQEQLRMGIKVEMEHTDDPRIAAEIARDHLSEYPDYYTRLARMEKEAEKAKKKKSSSPPIPDTPSRFEQPPLGYDDWEQFEREYGHEVDEHGN